MPRSKRSDRYPTAFAAAEGGHELFLGFQKLTGTPPLRTWVVWSFGYSIFPCSTAFCGALLDGCQFLGPNFCYRVDRRGMWRLVRVSPVLFAGLGKWLAVGPDNPCRLVRRNGVDRFPGINWY